MCTVWSKSREPTGVATHFTLYAIAELVDFLYIERANFEEYIAQHTESLIVRARKRDREMEKR